MLTIFKTFFPSYFNLY
jgi:hypothetical protein